MLSTIHLIRLKIPPPSFPRPKDLTRNQALAITGVVVGALALVAFVAMFLTQSDLLPMDAVNVGIGVSSGIIASSLLDVGFFTLSKKLLPDIMAKWMVENAFQDSEPGKGLKIIKRKQRKGKFDLWVQQLNETLRKQYQEREPRQQTTP